jgi:HD-GYP domain-containing protein (c-di-GMP phosphodiesterase class II)
MHPADLSWRLRDAVAGPSGWRSLVGPFVFALAGIALLIYDHLQDRVTDAVFWLTLMLIAAVFGRMLETNRRQSRALEEKRQAEQYDRITALPNRRRLEFDLEATFAGAGAQQVMVLLELDGLQAYGDRFGAEQAAEMLRRSAQSLLAAVMPFGGQVYRVDTTRLAALVPTDERPLSEVVLAATGSQHTQDMDTSIGRVHGEVAIPSETGDLESAFQIAGQRLAAHRRRQNGSARRQAHAVLVAALSASRPEQRTRLRSVAYRSISLGRRLGLSEEEIEDVALAAELQGVGMLSVPESVGTAEGGVSEEERAAVNAHTAVGGEIVGAAPALAPVATLIRSSAEHFDGSGYPDGLAGEAIPRGSRIVAVATRYAALTSGRSYRPGLPPEAALAELRRGAGTRFDPAIVEALAAELAEEAPPAANGQVSAPTIPSGRPRATQTRQR